MLYKDFVKNLKGCPFCDFSNNQIVKENASAYITFSIAPYHKHHLLVIPKRHFEKILEATNEENANILSLIKDGILIMERLGYKNYVVLVREGNEKTAKSISHLHYHVIPDTPIGMLDGQTQRKVMTESEIEETLKDFRGVVFMGK